MAKTASTIPNQNLSAIALKVVLIAGLFLFILLLGLYQGLVDTTHSPLSLRTVFSPIFWQQIKSRSWSQDPKFLSCDENKSQDDSPIIYDDTSAVGITCQKGCVFTITEKTDSKAGPQYQVPLATEQDMKDPKVTTAQLLGADLTKGRLVYYVPQYQRIYYTDISNRADPKLLQEISLSPDRKDPMRFLAIKRSTVGEDFLVTHNSARQEIYLYNLDALWLKKINLHQQLDFTQKQSSNESSCLTISDQIPGESKNWNMLR